MSTTDGYRFLTVDVFTERRFGGNPLAVLPDARGLDGAAMQRIAREFNYSETTFVLPAADAASTRRVRIFTPAHEVPFAGHPNVGTAFVLASIGAVPAGTDETRVVFEEDAGPVPVTIRWRDGRPVGCELTAPAPLAVGAELEVGAVAAAVGIPADAVVTTTHRPLAATVGIGFVVVELRDRAALAAAAPHADRLAALGSGETGIHLYTRDAEDPAADIQCRMFAPHAGVPEDPATGSANCVLAGLLARLDPKETASLRYVIDQGLEMGRPSRLLAAAEKAAGEVVEIRIGGACVPVTEGSIEV